jgi:uncharacterized membrane protein YozB (DUF420 family)
MDFYLLVSTMTLVIQLIVFVLLIAGYTLKRRKSFRRHGFLMVSAVFLHLISVLIIMVPSFEVIAFTVTGLSGTVVALSIVHGVFGLTALVLGIWISASWRFRQGLQYCAPKKRLMLVTFAVWTIAILFGIMLYFILYMPLMV